MEILLTPPPTEMWSRLPRDAQYRRPAERLRGLSRGLLKDLGHNGFITIVTVTRPGSSQKVQLVNLRSLDLYLERLAVQQELSRDLPRREEAGV